MNCNQLTPNASLALLALFSFMIKCCLKKHLKEFVESLLEWTYRVFKKHIISFVNNGGWNIVTEIKRPSSYTFQVTTVVVLGLFLIIRVLRN